MRQRVKAHGVAALLLAVIAVTLFVARPFAAHASSGAVYVDPSLHFSLTLPDGWLATPAAITHPSATRSALSIEDPAHPDSRIRVSVARTSAAAAAFAEQHGRHGMVGAYPALLSETPASAQSPQPCVTRTLLAASDLVTAQLCGSPVHAQTGAFVGMLATYRSTASPEDLAATAIRAQRHAAPVTCAGGVAARANVPTGDTNWGRELASPLDPRWGGLQAPGVSVCSNWISNASADSDTYLFQCVELVNRFIEEEWGIPWIDGNAGMYLDYALGEKTYPGTVKQLNSTIYPYTIADDASQGASAFPPVPGDVLVFQDVSDPKGGWTSGMIGVGHVAIITAVDAKSVSLFQQNFDWAAAPDTYFYQTLPMTHTANGWHITPEHVSEHRITRGWIHFAVNSTTGSMPFNAIGRTATGQLDAFATGADHALWHNPQTAPGTWAGWARIGQPEGVRLDGVPVAGYARGQGQSVYVTGSDGHLWLTTQQTAGAWGAWQPLDAPPGARVASDPTLASAQTTEVVSVRGSDGAVWQRTRDLFTWAWEAWQSLGVPERMILAGAPVAVAHEHTVDIFIQAQPTGDGAILLAHRSLAATSRPAAWSPWEVLGSPTTEVSVASLPSLLGETASMAQALFVAGSDGNLWARVQRPDGAWGAWLLLPCAITGRPLATLHNGTIEVLSRGPQGDLLDLTHPDDTTDNWPACASLGGTLASGHDLTAAVRVDGSQTLLARDGAAHAQALLTLDATAKGVWSQWAPLPGLTLTETESTATRNR